MKKQIVNILKLIAMLFFLIIILVGIGFCSYLVGKSADGNVMLNEIALLISLFGVLGLYLNAIYSKFIACIKSIKAQQESNKKRKEYTVYKSK